MKKTATIFILSLAHIASSAAEPSKDNPGGRGTLASDNGRYVFGQISANRQDQFMVDTRTGRMWQLIEGKIPASADGSAPTTAIFLKPVPFSDGTGKISLEPK